MNIIDATVVSINSKPINEYDKWLVNCTVEAWGVESEHIEIFDSFDSASSMSAGDKVYI